MRAGTGLYVIKMDLDSFCGCDLNGVGVCLKDVDLDENWCGLKHFVWGMWEDYSCPKFRIPHVVDDNVFYQKCKLSGDAFPELETFDEIEMVYDSNKGELGFKKNGEYLSSIVQNLNFVGDLYWCVGVNPTWRQFIDVSIVN